MIGKGWIKNHYHVIASIFIFAMSLYFDGYYGRNDHTSQWGGLLLLLFGWLGFVDFQFSWYANPLYIASLVHRKNKLVGHGLVSLSLALSFLLYRTIADNEGGVQNTIVRYGLGYYLWVLAIAVLAIGALSEHIAAKKSLSISLLKGLSLGAVVAVAAPFFLHYFWQEHRQFALFKEKCRLAVEEVYGKPGPITGIYFSPEWGRRFKVTSGGYLHSSGGGILANGMLAKGFLSFYETDNSAWVTLHQKPYRRFFLHDHKGEEVDQLRSEYSVVAVDPLTDQEKELSIEGSEIQVVERWSGTVLAKTTFFVNQRKNKFCGCTQSGVFSTEDFVIRALSLDTSRVSVDHNADVNGKQAGRRTEAKKP